MRYYYKKGNSICNMSTPHFIKYRTEIETHTQKNENGEDMLDENGQPITYTEEKQVEDGLLDGYTQITEEEYKACMQAMKPKFN